MRPTKIIQCKVCGVEKTVERSKPTVYCSKKCVIEGTGRKKRLFARGDMKQCEVCGVKFTVKNSGWCRTCSRKCGATLRIKEGKNGPKDKRPDWQKRLVRFVRKTKRKAKRSCELKSIRCTMCNCRWMKPNKMKSMLYCPDCKPKMRMLYHGYTEFRTRICMICRKPRTNDHLITDAGKYCEPCGKLVQRKRDSVHSRNRIRKMRANGPVDSSISLMKLCVRDDFTCHICNGRVDWTQSPQGFNDYPSIDHIKPISKGGTHQWHNVKLAHRRCNTIKSDNEYFLISAVDNEQIETASETLIRAIVASGV